MVTAVDVQSQLSTHEQVCAERYEKIEMQFASTNARLKRIESIMVATAGTLIVGAFGAMFTLLLLLQKMG
jgi:hypothetical protein